MRYLLTRDARDLNAAVASAEASASALPGDPADRSYCLGALAKVQLAQFERFGDQADLDRAVETARRAVASLRPGDPLRAQPASDLAACLSRRYEIAGAFDALTEARNSIQESLTLAGDDDDPERSVFLAIRAVIQWLTYEQFGDVTLLDAAEADADEALAAMPPGHVQQPFVDYSTGMIAFRRYERAGNLAVLERAIGLLRQAAGATERGNYQRAAYLSALGMSLGRRFERTGAPDDLDDAIDHPREAVATSSSRNDRPVWLSNLALYLRRRFERAGDEADIDEAVEAGRAAVTESGADFSGRAILHSGLGGSLIARHSQFRRMTDLDEAVEIMRSAVHIATPGQIAYPMHLMNLGLAVSERFDRTGELPDAEASVRYCREALKALPDGHADVPFYWRTSARAWTGWLSRPKTGIPRQKP